jgi:hypothetical protein
MPVRFSEIRKPISARTFIFKQYQDHMLPQNINMQVIVF